MKIHKVKTIYDDLKGQIRFLKIIIGFQAIIVLLALLTNVKPPIVIRETDNGAHVMTDYQSDSFVSADQARYARDNPINPPKRTNPSSNWRQGGAIAHH